MVRTTAKYRRSVLRRALGARFEGGPLVEIAAAREIVASAAQHHHAHAVVDVRRAQQRVQLGHHLAGQGVLLARLVQVDDLDAAFETFGVHDVALGSAGEGRVGSDGFGCFAWDDGSFGYDTHSRFLSYSAHAAR